MKKRIMAGLVICLCLFAVLAGSWGSVVFAAEGEKAAERFSGDVEMLKKDSGNYIMQITAENKGEDFTGTVQAIFKGTSLDNCAYNTEITLPAQGKKQFTITVPERAADTVRGLCALNFLDGKGKVIWSASLKNVFGNTMAGIPVGILSDNYTGLGYMDAGGEDYQIQNMSYPLKLIELNNDNLQTYLDGLYFMVIDQFNVASLSKENIQAIQEWVEGGGWLLIGTGAYAEQTLSGFEEDFLGVECLGLNEPGEENAVADMAYKYGYYYNYEDAEVDFSQMTIADLNYGNYADFYESAENPAICGSFGDGAVSVFYFSFGEKELQKMEYYMIRSMYDETMYRSNSYSQYGGYSDMDYTGQRMLSYIDNQNTKVDFTWLEVLIGVYVVLAGPVLYLVLRKCKKNEWYWIGVPVLGLSFIAGVFFFGQGARVNETKVYSVTAQRVDANRADTYFLAYHSGIKEWRLKLSGRFEAAGPGFIGYSYYGSKSSVDDYHYIVSNDSEGMSVGLKPRENFESGYFYAGCSAESKGTISGTDIRDFGSDAGPKGTVANETNYDLAYMAVFSDSYIMVFSDVAAGETLDLQRAVQAGRCVYQNSIAYYGDIFYDLVYSTGRDYEQDDMAALAIGLGLAMETEPAGGSYALITGVVRDYDKTAEGRCNEISYGCLYSYVKMEEKKDASN